MFFIFLPFSILFGNPILKGSTLATWKDVIRDLRLIGWAGTLSGHGSQSDRTDCAYGCERPDERISKAGDLWMVKRANR